MSRGAATHTANATAINQGIETSDLLRSLMEWDSPSGHEQPAIEGIVRLMRGLGIRATTQRVGRRANVIVRQEGRNPTILLVSHVDTVPRRLSRAGVVSIEGDKVRGLGACDAKGSVAAMILAYEELRRTPRFAAEVALALVVGEEVSGDGGLGLVKAGIKPRYALVGEPTSLVLPWGQAGYLQMRLTARGEPHHAFARHGPSAMDYLLDSIQKLKSLVDFMGRDLPPEERPYLFVQRLRGGSKDKFWYLRHECDAILNVNIHPKWNGDEFAAQAKAAVEGDSRNRNGVVLSLSVLDWEPGVRFSSQVLTHAVRSALASNGLRTSETYMPSWTDAATLEWNGTRTLVIGPGTLDVAHSQEEWVSLNEVEAAVKVYIDAVRNLLLEADGH